MGKLPTKTDVMNDVGVGAGLLLNAEPTIDSTTGQIVIDNSTILGVTRGGITFNAGMQFRKRTFDGIAPNTVGTQVVDRYEPTVAATFVTGDLPVLLKGVGFGDIEESELKPRHEIKSTDYVDVWFVELMSDGGAKIYHLMNTICTASAGVKTNDNGETEIPLTFEANYDIDDQDTPPFEIKRVTPVEPTPDPEPVVETPATNTQETNTQE